MIQINWLEQGIDTVFNILGKYSKWLNVRGKRINFILTSICLLYWVGRDFQVGMYSSAFFAIFSLALNVYGYWNWKNKGIGT